MATLLAALLSFSLPSSFSVPSVPLWLQEDDEDQLTPEQAMEMLKDIYALMGKAEEYLNDSSRGKALETDRELLERFNRDFPSDIQKAILEKVKKLTERTEKKQKDAIDKLAEIIKKAKASNSNPSKDPSKDPKKGDKSAQPRKPGDPATDPYDPTRNGQPDSPFRSKGDSKGWGNLPPHVRNAMLSGKRDIDEFPPEYQEELRRYFEELGRPTDK